MSLRGLQRKSTANALIDAYNRSSLSIMVLTEMDVRLDTIARDGNFEEVVYDLITWAEREGRTQELIHKANADIPGSTKLGQLYTDSKEWDFDDCVKQPTRKETLKKILWWLSGAVIIGILGLTIFWSTIVDLTFALKAMRVEDMTGAFNIAIADFDNVNQRWYSLSQDAGQIVSNTIFTSMSTNTSANDIGEQRCWEVNQEIAKDALQLCILGPDNIGIIRESKAAKHATMLAEEINASMVIYGTATTEDDGYLFQPSFYIYPENAYLAQSVIVGEHHFGSPLKIPKQSTVKQGILKNELIQRLNALIKISIGLEHYSLRQFKEALSYFQEAESVLEPNDSAQKIVALLAGNALLKDHTSDPLTSEKLNMAKAYYENALKIDNKFSRAYLGLSDFHYLMAVGSYQLPGESQAQELESALKALDQAEKYQPPSDFVGITSKILFKRGQILFLSQIVLGQNDFDDAMANFERVVQNYQASNALYLKELASEAHGRQGLIYCYQNELLTATKKYQSAIALSVDEQRKEHYQNRIDLIAQQKEDGSHACS